MTFADRMSSWKPASILLLGARYAAAYVLFALMVKAMPTAPGALGSTAVLPGFALGLAFGLAPLIQLFKSRAELLAPPPAPSAARWSGVAAALVAVTTVLIYRVEGVTILLALLLMRGGVLAIAPILDRLSGQPVQRREDVAVLLSLAAVALGLLSVADPGNYLPLAVLLPLYLAGNGWRLRLMLRHAKRPVPGQRAAWLVAEFHIAILMVAAGAGAAIAVVGFPPPDVLGFGVVIGLVYAAVLGWGSTVYLDPSNTSLSVVVNRGASMLAGVVASLLAGPLLGQPLPGASTWVAALLVVLAVMVCTFAETRSGTGRG